MGGDANGQSDFSPGFAELDGGGRTGYGGDGVG